MGIRTASSPPAADVFFGLQGGENMTRKNRNFLFHTTQITPLSAT